MPVVFLDKHGAISVDSACSGTTTNAGPCQGTITGLTEAGCHKRPYCATTHTLRILLFWIIMQQVMVISY